MLPELGGVGKWRGPTCGVSGSLRDPEPVRVLRAGPRLLRQPGESGPSPEDPAQQGAGPLRRVLRSSGEDSPSPALGAARPLAAGGAQQHNRWVEPRFVKSPPPLTLFYFLPNKKLHETHDDYSNNGACRFIHAADDNRLILVAVQLCLVSCWGFDLTAIRAIDHMTTWWRARLYLQAWLKRGWRETGGGGGGVQSCDEMLIYSHTTPLVSFCHVTKSTACWRPPPPPYIHHHHRFV